MLVERVLTPEDGQFRPKHVAVLKISSQILSNRLSAGALYFHNKMNLKFFEEVCVWVFTIGYVFSLFSFMKPGMKFVSSSSTTNRASTKLYLVVTT
jgi:hypothetical protein